jgi:hypothetical protein
MKNNICWYTGLICDDTRSQTAMTREHLLSCHRYRNIQFEKIGFMNVVPACSLVNNAIGNAPVQIKYALRDYIVNNLKKGGDKSGRFSKHNLDMVRSLTDKFLHKFRIYKNQLAWDVLFNEGPLETSRHYAKYRAAWIYTKIIYSELFSTELDFIKSVHPTTQH